MIRVVLDKDDKFLELAVNGNANFIGSRRSSWQTNRF